MGEQLKTEYRIIPKEPFKIIRNCSGCGCKMSYSSTENFRVNANGPRLDVWLIYQCSKCKHTYNIPIYERIRAMDIEKKEYQCFLSNERELAFQYGLNKELMARHKIEIDWEELGYDILVTEREALIVEETPKSSSITEKTLLVTNPYGLKIREERIAAELLHLTRSKVKKLIKEEKIKIEQNLISKTLEIRVNYSGAILNG